MSNNQEVKGIIERYASIIVDDIATRKVYNKDDVRAFARVTLTSLAHDVLTAQRDTLMEKRTVLAKQYTECKSHREKMALAGQLADLNSEIKRRNKSMNSLDNIHFKEVGANLSVPKKQKITGSNPVAVGRLYEKGEIKVFQEGIKRTQTRKFTCSLTYNTHVPGKNESNFVEFHLKNDHVHAIDPFSKYDLVAITYNISANQFLNTKGEKTTAIYLHASKIVSAIIDMEELNQGESDERSVARDAQ